MRQSNKQDLRDIMRNALDQGVVNQPAVCEYCDRKFAQVKTLAAHKCEPKRRWDQKNDLGPRLGMVAFDQFWRTAYPNSAPRTYSDFVNSVYYRAFVKFGWYAHGIDAVDPQSYVAWLLKNNKNLDKWCSDRYYETYLNEYVKQEKIEQAIERSLRNIDRWCEKNSVTLLGVFRHVPANIVCYEISKGKISPWFLYATSSGVAFVEHLNTDQIRSIYSLIDPDYWMRIIAREQESFDFYRELLSDQGF